MPPTPNSYRAGSGVPGHEYWQQRVDYAIRATLDTAGRSLRGEERITYTNNSPDTLRHLWLHLDQNLFSSESRGFRIFDQHSRFGTGGAEGGMRILKVAQPALPAARGRRVLPFLALILAGPWTFAGRAIWFPSCPTGSGPRRAGRLRYASSRRGP